MADAPVLVDLLAPLLQITAVAFAIGCCVLIYYFVKALFGAIANFVRLIPLVGSALDAAVHKAENAVTDALSGAIKKMETHIGHEWTHLSQFMHSVWEEQVRVAENLWSAVKRINRLVTTAMVTDVLHHALHALTHLFHATTGALHREVHGVSKALRATIRYTVHRIARLEHAIDVAIPKEIKYARDLAREAEDGVARLWKAVRALPTEATIAGLIAAAIAALGLPSFDFLRCGAFNKILRRGCGGIWGGLEDLLGLLIDAIALTHLCDLPGWINEFFSPFLGELSGLISSAANALCAKPKGDWVYPSVTVPASTLPPAQHVGQLP